MKRRFLICLAAVCCITIKSSIVSGQSKVNTDKLKTILASVKSMENYGYDYLITMNFPDGNAEKIVGEMYARNKERMMYNSSSIHEMLLTADWFYRANHHDKTVTVVDLKTSLSKEAKERKEDMFNGYITSYFIDSIVLRYGVLKNYKEQQDTIAFKLSFSLANTPLKSIELKFDYKNRIPILMKVTSFYPTGRGSATTPEGTWQTVTCTNYTLSRKGLQLDPSSYFTRDGKSIHLKKYTNYKISSYL